MLHTGARRLKRDAEQQKYSEIATLVSVTVGREQFRNAKPRFHTAWVIRDGSAMSALLPLCCQKPTFTGRVGMSQTWQTPTYRRRLQHLEQLALPAAADVAQPAGRP
jgi:hypothetical protein